MWRILQSVYFIGVPALSDRSAKIYFDIWDAKTETVIYSSKDSEIVKYEYINDEIDRNEPNELLPEKDRGNIIVSGDLLFKIRNGSAIMQSKLWRFSINSAFLDNYIEIGRDELDPDSFK